MTHHIKPQKEFVEGYLKKIKSAKEVLYSTRCCWCTKRANQFKGLGPDNFVAIEGKSFDGKQAVTLLCDECLGRPERVNDPKKAFIMEERVPNEWYPTQIELRELHDDEDYHFGAGVVEIRKVQEESFPVEIETVDFNLPAEKKEDGKEEKTKKKMGLFGSKIE